MNARVFLIATVIGFAGLFTNASAQTANNNKEALKYQQANISVDENDMVIVKYSDTFVEGRRKMVVRVFDENRELIYARHLWKKGDVQLGYNISQFPEGDYTFELYKKRDLVLSETISKQTDNNSVTPDADIIVKAK